jgi:hypothetical protein
LQHTWFAFIRNHVSETPPSAFHIFIIYNKPHINLLLGDEFGAYGIKTFAEHHTLVNVEDRMKTMSLQFQNSCLPLSSLPSKSSVKAFEDWSLQMSFKLQLKEHSCITSNDTVLQ